VHPALHLLVVLRQGGEHARLTPPRGAEHSDPVLTAPAPLPDVLVLDQPPVHSVPVRSRRRLRDPLASAGRVVTRHRARRLRERDERTQEECRLLRRETIGSIDHELRTPLTSIVGYTEIVLSGEVGSLNETQTHMLERVAGNAADLLALIEDMISVTNAWVIEGREVDLVDLAGHVMAERATDPRAPGGTA
jgi:signal transduction histidine kinase